jgi:hypothetical protein
MVQELSPESFESWASQLGIEASAEHLDVLRGEVRAILMRIAPLADIDTSEVAPEEAGLRQDGGDA